MIPILDQDNAGSFITRVSGFRGNVLGMRESTMNSIEVIGEFANRINNFISYIDNLINNPIIITTFINQSTLIVLIVLILLKMLGFEKLEKWITLLTIVKVIMIILL